MQYKGVEFIVCVQLTDGVGWRWEIRSGEVLAQGVGCHSDQMRGGFI